MAVHQVKMRLQSGLTVKKGDVIFEVKRSGRRYGSLKVSNGSVVWRKKNNKSGRKLSWRVLNELFDERGRKEKR